MDISKVLEFYKIASKEGIVLSYQGPFLQEIIEEISTVMNNRLSDYSQLKINGKFLSLFIELSQNILRYATDSIIDKNGAHISSGLIITGLHNGKIYIISGNLIDKKHEKILKEKLIYLGNCSKEELNKLFKEQLRGINTNEHSKGAGLGLIDISRKAETLEYSFNNLETGETFFTIKTEYKMRD